MAKKCAPRNWLRNQIEERQFNCFNVEPEYFILNDTTAGEYWKLSENFDDTLGTQINKQYAVIGTDGEYCIKAIFLKAAVENAVSNFIVDSQSSSMSVDWRHCSLYLTKFYFKLMLPTNSLKPEIILIVENFIILDVSDVDALDCISGFMNYCMNFKNVQTIVTEEYCREKLKKIDEECKNATVVADADSQNDHNMSILISELMKKVVSNGNAETEKVAAVRSKRGEILCDASVVQNVNISIESDDCPPLKKCRQTLLTAPIPTVDLWKNAPNDIPGWKIRSSSISNSPIATTCNASSPLMPNSPLVTSSPIVPKRSPSISSVSNAACVNEGISSEAIDVVANISSITIENDTDAKNFTTTIADDIVYTRSARIQTSNKMTGWTNDQQMRVDVDSSEGQSLPTTADPTNHLSSRLFDSHSKSPANENLIKDNLPGTSVDVESSKKQSLSMTGSRDPKTKLSLNSESIAHENLIKDNVPGMSGVVYPVVVHGNPNGDLVKNPNSTSGDDDEVTFLGEEVSYHTSIRTKIPSDNYSLCSKHSDDNYERDKSLEVPKSPSSYDSGRRRSACLIDQPSSTSSLIDDDFYQKFRLSDDLKQKCLDFIFD